MVQSIVFKCQPIIPIVIAIRFPKSVDSIDQTHKARQIKRINILPEGFTSIKGNSISMKAGTNLELKLKSFGLLTDSSVQYRITNSKDQLPAIWQTSGHVLTLPNLPSDNIYKLELRYLGQPYINSYTINISPFWHQLLWVRLTAVVLLITIVIIITRWYFRRNIRLITAQRQRLEEQLTTIQSQLNPHFIFNALSSIEGLVSGGKNKLANEYLTTFSLIMRETLNNADKLLISLKEEIALLEKYISIEELRFGFNFSISIDDHIHPDEIQVPPMLAQPLIENAVKHGAVKDGKLALSIRKESNNMLIQVTNSKAGIVAKVQTAGGYGLTFTKERLKHFSSLHPETPIEFDFTETETSFEATLRFVNWFA
nr:histidine kinase [uncultured Sediminibacterium sp.]